MRTICSSPTRRIGDLTVVPPAAGPEWAVTSPEPPAGGENVHDQLVLAHLEGDDMVEGIKAYRQTFEVSEKAE